MWKLGEYPTSPHEGNEKKFKYNSWFLPSNSFRLVMLPHLRAHAGRVQKMGFLGQNGFEASELMRAHTNAVPKARLCLVSAANNHHNKTNDDLNLRQLIHESVKHYEEYYKAKADGAKGDMMAMFRPPRTTLVDLSLNQINGVDELQRKTIRAESVGICRVDLSSMASEILRKNNDGDGEIKESVRTLNSLLGSKEDKLEEVLHMADGLRMETLKSVMEILTPLQVERFLIAAAELHLRLHDWGQKRDITYFIIEKDVVSVSPYGPDSSLDYRIENTREFVFKWSVVRQMNQIM
nr:hypothetical protein [Tanacetum cinerariifolium]